MADPVNASAPAPDQPPVPEGMLYMGANSVARWYIEFGFAEGKPCLLAKQVFLDAPKQASPISRQLAAGRIFFSLKQLEMLMQIRHGVEVSLSDADRVRVALHLAGR
jgi:hypothetical protein